MHKISYWNDQAVPEDDSRRSASRNNNNRLNYNMMQSSKFITYRTNKQQHFSDDGGKTPNHKNTVHSKNLFWLRDLVISKNSNIKVVEPTFLNALYLPGF